MNLKLFNDNILVIELQDDMVVNGVLNKYDSDSPYMFCKVIGVSKEASSSISVDDIVIIKRYAKEEYLPGYYFVSLKDVRGSISLEDYKSLLEGGTE